MSLIILATSIEFNKIEANAAVSIPKITHIYRTKDTNNNNLISIFDAIGRYKFNIAAGCNINNQTPPSNIGVSHLNICKDYEENRTSPCTSLNLPGNSSGCQLLKENSDDRIHKAYLIVDTSSAPRDITDNKYYVKLLYSNNNTTIQSGIETNFEYIDYKLKNNGICNGAQATQIVEVTDFVKNNGYGYYYLCNIPDYYKNGVGLGDNTGQWKLVVIEKNNSLPLRAISLDAGLTLIGSSIVQTHKIKEISLPDGIKTKSTGDVSGQALIGVWNNDFDNAGTATTHESFQFYLNSAWNHFSMTNNLRRKNKTFPMVMNRNNKRIPAIENYDGTTRYYNILTGKFTASQTDWRVDGGDVMLIDINSNSSSVHNMKFDNNSSSVKYRIGNAAEFAVCTLGLCADIDCFNYSSQQTTTINSTTSVTVSGKSTNTTSIANIGVINGSYIVYLDNQLSATSATATMNDGTTINGSINNSDHTVEFSGVSTITKDTWIEYTIACSASSGSLSYYNSAEYNGYYYNNTQRTDFIEQATVASSSAQHTHTYTSSITTQPTCTAKGVRTYTCSGCGHTYTEDIDALGHLHPDDYSYEDNSGVTEGFKYKKCLRCGIYLEKLYRVLLNKGTGIDSVSGANYYTEGANVSIDATVNQHYNWSNWTGTTTYSNKNTSFSMPSNAVSLTANATPKNYYLDLNGYLDGKYVGNITDYGTADIYIENTLKADNVSDYYAAHPYPSTYEIKDIQAIAKHRYKGLYSTSDSLSGTLDGNKSIVLMFNTVYTVTYDGNKATSGNTESQEFEHGESIQLRENGYKKDNYEFDSWNTTAKGDGTKYLPGQTYSTCADLKLYAKWKRTLSLTFDMNGGQYKGKSDSVVLKGTVYNDNKEYTFKIKNNEATEASYPDWDVQDGTIDAYGKYDANGINNSYAKTINSVPCRFLGWSLDKNATEPDDGLWVYRENLSELTIKDDTTLYAIWEPILQCKVDLRRSLGDIQFDYGPVNTTGVINAISTSKSLVALIKPGEQGQYEIISSNNNNAKVDVTFDSKITDIYDNTGGIWVDSLNPWTPESSSGAKCGLNRHIENQKYILRKFNMPLYIGTNMSYATSIGVKEYTVQFIITQESKFHTSGERIIVNGKIYITDNLAEGDEPDTVLDELRTRLKIRIK